MNFFIWKRKQKTISCKNVLIFMSVGPKELFDELKKTQKWESKLLHYFYTRPLPHLKINPHSHRFQASENASLGSILRLAKFFHGIQPHDVEISHSVGHSCHSFNFRFTKQWKTLNLRCKKLFIHSLNSFV